MNRRRGFTLLELLVAMAMVAVVAVSLVASLRIAFKARESAESSLDAGRSAELVMEFIRTDLQTALPPGGSFAGSFEGTDNTDARGADADDLVFYGVAPASVHPQGANGDIKQLELTCYQPNGSSDFVLVRRTTNNLLNPQQEPYDEEVLCRHVSGFNCRYYDGAQWLDTWDSTQQNNSLPAAVEVTLSLQAPDKNADGSPRVARYTRVFAMPCFGTSVDQASASSSGSASSPEADR